MKTMLINNFLKILNEVRSKINPNWKEEELKRMKNHEYFCELCFKKMDFFEFITHHLDYSIEKRKIDICRSCHAKIHLTNKIPELKPKQKRPLFFNDKNDFWGLIGIKW